MKAAYHVLVSSIESMQGQLGVNLGSTCTVLPKDMVLAAAAAGCAAANFPGTGPFPAALSKSFCRDCCAAAYPVFALANIAEENPLV